ncbi:MAG: di/tricarboxylate transporter [Alphaproteobacteria bacterium]|jgi:di/tricarboxylate transporter
MTQATASPFGASQIIATITTLVSIVLVAAPLWTADGSILQAAGIVLFSVALWATGAIPIHITALIMFTATVVLDIAPPNVVFAGFHASATWLVFGGLVITIAVQRSGLATRAVQALVVHLPAHYFGMALGIALAGVVLAFFMPSASARAVLMAPLAMALADRLGFAENTQARFGLVIAAALGSTVPAFGILPSTVVSMAFAGVAESIHGISFTYFDYTLLNFPILGALGLLIQTALITFMFGAQPQPDGAAEKGADWSGDERRLLIILVVALALWMTDSLHGISPAWIAMAAALLCITPRIGMLSSKVLTADVNYGPWLFIAGVIGMGAIANHTGLGAALGELLLANVPLTADGGLLTFYQIFVIGGAINLVATAPIVAPIMTTFADAIAQATNWPIRAVLFAEVPSFMVFPLPHQAPPIVITMAIAGVPIRAGVRVLAVYFVIAVIVILPLQYLWGRALGVYP